MVPAAMDTRVKGSFRAARTAPSSASSSSSIWGFTPRKIKSARAAVPLLSESSPPSSAARAAAFSGWRFASRSRFSTGFLEAARARAPPMLPVPINPRTGICNTPFLSLIIMLFSASFKYMSASCQGRKKRGQSRRRKRPGRERRPYPAKGEEGK